MDEHRGDVKGISKNRNFNNIENPWNHVREVTTTSDKLSSEYMSFQHQSLPTSHLGGLNEIRSHYWGRGRMSIIREKIFMPAKKGLNWSLSPQNGNGGDGAKNHLHLGFRSIPLIGYESECALGIQEKERPVPVLSSKLQDSPEILALRSNLSMKRWAQAAADNPRPLRDREDAKVRLGSEFSLKKFHSYALKIGPMGLDPFAVELANWDGK